MPLPRPLPIPPPPHVVSSLPRDPPPPLLSLLHPRFVAAVNTAFVDSHPNAFSRLAPSLWATPLLSDEGARKIVDFFNHPASPISTQHKRYILSDPSSPWRQCTQDLFDIIRDIAPILFPEHGDAAWMWPDMTDMSFERSQFFLVKYVPDPHDPANGGGLKALSKHFDKCTITLNLCLALNPSPSSFRGSLLSFFSHAEHTHPFLTYSHTPGHALFHLGGLWHAVTPVEVGERWGIIAFLR